VPDTLNFLLPVKVLTDDVVLSHEAVKLVLEFFVLLEKDFTVAAEFLDFHGELPVAVIHDVVVVPDRIHVPHVEVQLHVLVPQLLLIGLLVSTLVLPSHPLGVFLLEEPLLGLHLPLVAGFHLSDLQIQHLILPLELGHLVVGLVELVAGVLQVLLLVLQVLIHYLRLLHVGPELLFQVPQASLLFFHFLLLHPSIVSLVVHGHLLVLPLLSSDADFSLQHLHFPLGKIILHLQLVQVLPHKIELLVLGEAMAFVLLDFIQDPYAFDVPIIYFSFYLLAFPLQVLNLLRLRL